MAPNKKINSLEYFTILHKKYLRGDYVFKKSKDINSIDKTRKWLVILQKTKNTITNELRKGVFDSRYAKFRGNEFRVIKIINVNNPKRIKKTITNSYGSHKIDYTVGEIVRVDNFDMVVDNIYSGGVHYFNSIEPAYFYEDVPSNFTGTYYGWHDGGEKEMECEYVKGKKNGKYNKWYQNGQKWEENEYLNGEESGNGYILWYTNGQKCVEW